MRRSVSTAVLFVGLLTTVTANQVRAQDAVNPGDKYALLVGVRQYDPTELRNLPFSEKDVTTFAQVLRDNGYRAENVVLMTQTKGAEDFRFLPTSQNIRTQLNLLLKRRMRTDSVVVAFAGHGVQFSNDTDGHFCPMDAKLGDVKSLVSLKEIYQELEACNAAFKLLLVDACRNDPRTAVARSKDLIQIESVSRPQLQMPPGGVAALFSCCAGQRAFEHEGLGHGVFFNFVIQGLRGEADADRDRKVSLPELELFVKKRVPDYVRAHLSSEQTPDLRGNTRGLVPVVQLDGSREIACGFFGFRMDPYLCRQLGLPLATKGMFVEGLWEGSAGAQAGLRQGDVVTSVNDQEVSSVAALRKELSKVSPGGFLRLKVLRSGKLEEFQVEARQRQTEAEIVQLLKPICAKGEPWAMRRLAMAHLNGHGVPQSHTDAIQLLRKAAELGDRDACLRLGLAYEKGRGVPLSDDEAARWYRLGAEKGYTEAQSNLGALYKNGKGLPKDPSQAMRWFQTAAEQENAHAYYHLGWCYLNGHGVATDHAEAQKWLEKSANLGYATAMNEIGCLYSHGRGVNKDDEAACQWFQRAAEKGNADAINNLGIAYEYGRGVVKDQKAAFACYEEAAELGSLRGQALVGKAYLRGVGVAADESKGIEMCRRAVEGGDLSAHVHLGAAYVDGKGVEKNDEEGVRLWRIAADKGYLWAMERMGWASERGRGVEKNPDVARSWYERAAAKGFGPAKVRLAELDKEEDAAKLEGR